ncbi:MAG: hypothetical protein Kow0068_04780 [Marinilabiliales bacterium]
MNIKRIVFTIVLFVLYIQGFSQNFSLTREDNPNKIKIFDNSMYLEYNLKYVDDEKYQGYKQASSFDGYLIDKEGSMLKIDCDYSVINRVNFDNGSEINDIREFYGVKGEEKNINIADIDYIVHHKKSEKVFNVIGSSALIGVIISPLFGMYFDDRKELKINEDNYVASVGFFAVVASISFSASKLFGQKKYYINSDYKDDKKTWKISAQ